MVDGGWWMVDDGVGLVAYWINAVANNRSSTLSMSQLTDRASQGQLRVWIGTADDKTGKDTLFPTHRDFAGQRAGTLSSASECSLRAKVADGPAG